MRGDPLRDLGGGGGPSPPARICIAPTISGIYTSVHSISHSTILERAYMPKTPNPVIADAISSVNETIALQKEKLAILKKSHKRLDKITSDISLILSGADDIYNSVHIYPYSDGAVSITISLRKLPSFKCKALEAMLEYCETLNVGKVESKDYAESLNRDYHFELADGWTIHVNAYVKSDSATCRKIKVGTEVVEQAKWEIQCD